MDIYNVNIKFKFDKKYTPDGLECNVPACNGYFIKQTSQTSQTVRRFH
jgi:hypothetical protein